MQIVIPMAEEQELVVIIEDLAELGAVAELVKSLGFKGVTTTRTVSDVMDSGSTVHPRRKQTKPRVAPTAQGTTTGGEPASTIVNNKPSRTAAIRRALREVDGGPMHRDDLRARVILLGCPTTTQKLGWSCRGMKDVEEGTEKNTYKLIQ